MSEYDRLASTTTGRGDSACYAIRYRDDKPLPAFLAGQKQGEPVILGRDVEWLAVTAREVADEMFVNQGRQHWINRMGDRCDNGRCAWLKVRGSVVTLRDQQGREIDMGWAGLNWMAWSLEAVRLAAADKASEEIPSGSQE